MTTLGGQVINVGLIGFGYWGPNLARNFNKHPECRLRRIVEPNTQRHPIISQDCPGCDISTSFVDVTRAKDIDLVAIATPVRTHYELAKDALLHGKHVWVEKPLTDNSEKGQDLIDMSLGKNLVTMVDHTYVFSPAVNYIKNYIAENKLGRLMYYDSVRVNLGLFQNDINVIWDLAPHDLSIVNHLFGSKIAYVSAVGVSHYNRKIENVGYVTLHLQQDMIIHFHLSWVSPVKIRQTLIGGEHSMIVWNDLSPDEAIKVYERGVEMQHQQGNYELLASYRKGAMFSPVLSRQEPLASAIDHMVKCVNRNIPCISDAGSGNEIVKILEAIDLSLKSNGSPVRFN